MLEVRLLGKFEVKSDGNLSRSHRAPHNLFLRI